MGQKYDETKYIATKWHYIMWDSIDISSGKFQKKSRTICLFDCATIREACIVAKKAFQTFMYFQQKIGKKGHVMSNALGNRRR